MPFSDWLKWCKLVPSGTQLAETSCDRLKTDHISLTAHILKFLHLCLAQDEFYVEIWSSLSSFPQQGSLCCGEAGRCLLAETVVEMGQHMWDSIVWYVERQFLHLVTLLLPEVGIGLCFYYVDCGIWKVYFLQQNDVSNQISSILTVSKLHFFS